MKKAGYLKYMSLIIALVFILVSCIPALARGEQNREKSVVILLDTSGSMRTNDPDRLALDSIAQLVYSLPSGYRTGIVTYGTEAALLSEAADNGHRDDLIELAKSVGYKGYSNAGAGLSSAVDALAQAPDGEKYIVLFSDGEILMKEGADTGESRQEYQAAADRAGELGITIYIIGLGEDMENPDNDIFKAAAATGGKSWHIAQVKELQRAIDAVLEEIGVKQSTIAIVDTGGGPEKVAVELPYLQADRIKVLMTCSAPLQNLNSSFQAESARQVNGDRYSLLEIERPTGGHLEISFEAENGSQVRINAIPEYSVIPRVEVTYEDWLSEEAEIPSYERTATLSCSFHSMENPGVSLWEDTFFDHSKITMGICGETEERCLLSGRLESQKSVTFAGEYEVSFDYSGLPVNVTGEDRVIVALETPPPVLVEEAPPPEFPVGAVTAGILLLLLLLAIIMILVLYLRRPKPAPVSGVEPPQPSRYSYVGKVNLYITRTRSGYDIPPLYYNLFRLPAGKVISLQEILKECEVLEEFPGAKGIYFKPGMDRSLILTNNSDCTIMKSREILMKSKSYQLAPDAKVDISFEDEISELTLQYKALNPSEKG